MTKVWSYLVLLLMLTAFTVGCDKQVADYVNGVKRNIPRTTPGLDEPMYFNISAGSFVSPATNGATGGAIEATITPKNQVLLLEEQVTAPTLPDPAKEMSISITMGRNRVKLQ